VKRGQHAADDGSFGRSAGGAMARGVALIIAAVLLGVVLLNATDTPSFEGVAADRTTVPSGDDGPTTTAGDGSSTTIAAEHDPASVTVLVANGAGINGLASKIRAKLNAANYVTAEPGNTKAPADESSVYFSPGYEADANAVAALLTPAPKVAPLPNPVPVADMKNANVLVVAAADLADAAG
jgi:hypothetical protein